MKKALQNYKSIIEPVWCPGCGDYGVLRSLQQALATLEIPPQDIIAVSGIGCSGRLSHYVNAYSLHGTHGRAIPTATGAKIARPELTVIAVGGDGDGLGIGGGHIPHAARKNIDITYLLLDNRVYGLTKGQASPTTPLGEKTKTSPQGVYEDPLNPLAVFLAYDVSFVARASSYDVKQLTDILVTAVRHKGMSIVYIISPCQTFPVLDPKKSKALFQPLPEDHDTSNRLLAMERSYTAEPLYTGIFYRIEKPTFEERLQGEIRTACAEENVSEPLTTEQVLQHFV